MDLKAKELAMQKHIDWDQKAEKAKGMSDYSLMYSIADCVDTMRVNSEDSGYYYYCDEASIYRAELRARGIHNYEDAIKNLLGVN